jgi:16S rRNA processing protein RimM
MGSDKSEALEKNSLDKDVPFGKVVGFLGLKGELKIRPTTNNASLLLGVDLVEIKLPSHPVITAGIASIRFDKKMLIIALEGYPDRTSVEHLEGAELFTSRDQIEELDEDEWWISDLVGLSVFTTEGKEIGKVVSIIGANSELLEIGKLDNPEATVLVPFVKDLVPVVDMKERRIEVVDLPGLLD